MQITDRSESYTPQMVRSLRDALLDAKVSALVGGGMKVEQARIHAAMQIEQWEINELAKQDEDEDQHAANQRANRSI